MVLHIGIDGIIDKNQIINRLIDFFTHKNYKCRKAETPANKEINQILDNYDLLKHEIALLYAFDRSLTYYLEDWEQYDLVFWNNTDIFNYVAHTDEKTPAKYIRQINKYYPKMDLYIALTTDNTYYNNKFKTLKNIIIIPYTDDEPKLTEEIVKAMFDNLPTCNWCPRLFKPNRKHKKYCSDECAKYSLEEQYRVNNREYYKRYKNTMSERSKGGLGSKNANLHGTADPNPLEELEKVRRGKRALGLKPIQ